MVRYARDTTWKIDVIEVQNLFGFERKINDIFVSYTDPHTVALNHCRFDPKNKNALPLVQAAVKTTLALVAQ